MSIESAVKKALESKGIDFEKQIKIFSNCNSNYIKPRVKTKHAKHNMLGEKIKDMKNKEK
uniref:Uncharacterized protein n=1 Tax=uncultured organism MedDCM-OCT-S04-C777 TaxID=743619 RepID=D6PK78_9ZZZZ|nr:hypothetical protein [uncultured organism MedDCM-OCT-S04-C777]